MLKKNKLKKIISRFKNKRVLVVGDLILDCHIFGNVNRISPEAPVPVVVAKNQTYRAGGAANVAMNLASLGAKASICGLIGSDDFGKKLNFLLKKNKINTSCLVKNKQHKTTLKTRIIAHHQQVVRVDWESGSKYSLQIIKKILDQVKKEINRFDAVIIEDYGKGMINPFLVKELVALCKKGSKIITVDPKDDHFCYYRGVTSLTPNLAEAQIAAGLKATSKNEIKKIGKKIIEAISPESLLLTLGEDGMMLFEKGSINHIPTAALEVYDVTGAGDTVISVFTLALLGGASHFEAAQIANLAAGLVVGKLGAAEVSRTELIKAINEKGN